jgi:aspartyl-tRNA(Asn)/glutamyl-tRNA(Gln) amidotransferase subunit B
VDCNISINGGNRVEIKNVSGYAAAEKALNYELNRQKQEVKMGRIIEQHTRAFNAESETTLMLRKKETEEDYGYIFDPDLVLVELSPEYINEVKSSLPELPEQKAKRLQEQFKLSEYDAKVICSDFELGKLFDEMIKNKADALLSARILTREVLAVLNHDSLLWKDVCISAKDLFELVALIKEGKVSDKNAKQAVINYISGSKESPKVFLEKNNLLISGEINIDEIVDKVILENAKAVIDYRAGNEKSINFLAGLAMRQTKGTASIQQILEKLRLKIK